jgi:dihydroorotase
MKDRTLVADTRVWGRSVHPLQHMPAAAPRHVDQTTAAIVAPGATRPEHAA